MPWDLCIVGRPPHEPTGPFRVGGQSIAAIARVAGFQWPQVSPRIHLVSEVGATVSGMHAAAVMSAAPSPVASPVALLLLAVLVGLLGGLVLGWFAAVRTMRAAEQARADAELSRAHARAAEQQAELGRRAAAAEARAMRLAEENEELLERSRSDADVLRALEPVRESLARLDAQVGTIEKNRHSQFSTLTTRLDEARRTDSALQEATSQLHRALHTSSSRGSWGEMELRRVLELSGLTRHVSFVEQVSLGSGPRAGRPDVVVHLPGDRAIAVDAKVPMDAYLKAAAVEVVDEDSARERTRLLAAHVAALRGHIDALASRDYVAGMRESLGVSAVDVIVAFVPTEGLLAQALDADPTLLDHAGRKKVVLAAPSSLLALLRSVASVWSEATVADEARELLELGRTLNNRLTVVVQHLDRLGQSLRTGVGHYNKAVGSMESRLLVSVRQLESLADDTAKVPRARPVTPDEAQVRQFASPELSVAAPDPKWHLVRERGAERRREYGVLEEAPGDEAPGDEAPDEEASA